MANDNWKLAAWQESFERAMDREQRVGCPSTVRAEWASKHADEALALMEQREREGRFGSDGPVENSKEWWSEKEALEKRADRAEAEAERLRAEPALSEEGASTLNGLHDVATERARKAESLLKEALRSAGRLMDALGHLVKYGRPAPGGEQIGNVDHIEQAMGAVGKALARARQEGFSDGE